MNGFEANISSDKIGLQVVVWGRAPGDKPVCHYFSGCEACFTKSIDELFICPAISYQSNRDEIRSTPQFRRGNTHPAIIIRQAVITIPAEE
jgi:hypothetical protein